MDADPFDVGLMIDAVRALRPRLAELDTLEALISMAGGRWDHAIQLLSAVVEASPQFSHAKGLLAVCLFSKGDPAWQQWANDAHAQNPDRATQSLVLALRARDDLRAAIRVSQSVGKFEVPASVKALQEACQPASTSAGAAPGSPDQLVCTGYLRI
jgi:type III secretion protein HrpB1